MATLTPQQLADKLGNITPEAKRKIKVAITKASLLVERDAKINAPLNKDPRVSRGTLRRSITHRVDESNNSFEGIVGTNVEYGKFQEYGTGQRGASSGVETPADYEYGSSNGIPAQPFLGPALQENKRKIQNLISRAIIEAIRGA